MEDLAKLIKAEADNLGFSFISFTEVKQTPHFGVYREWVNRGFHGSMRYLSKERTLKARQDPAILLDNARSMIVFGFQYNFLDKEKNSGVRPVGIISSYATYEDYHHFLKRKAKDLMANLRQKISEPFKYRIFVDSAPVMEKDNAFMAGVGWIGKNSLLISPTLGSFLFLGCILIDLEIQSSRSFSQDLCGDCRKCIQVCPSNCITENHSIDASQCVAYLTIEYKGIVPRELRRKIGNRVFGCDICQEVCPINKKVMKTSPNPQSALKQLTQSKVNILAELAMDETDFGEKYCQTPVSRTTYEGFRRNLIIALGNSRFKKAIPFLADILNSDPSWLLRLHSAWALVEINTTDSIGIVHEHLRDEKDERVRQEIIELLE